MGMNESLQGSFSGFLDRPNERKCCGTSAFSCRLLSIMLGRVLGTLKDRMESGFASVVTAVSA